MSSTSTPVALFIFKRPDETARVLNAIRSYRPRTLFVIADGPRSGRPEEQEKCSAARAVVKQIDWPCDVLTNYSDINLGCRQRVSSGLSWVFGKTEDAIILEDDCLPDPSFFKFCEVLLERYRHDTRIMVIAGNNFQAGRVKRNDDSYYYSRYNHCWGWASWARAWQKYDDQMTMWPQIRDRGWLKDILADHWAADDWSWIFQSVFEKRIDSWAYCWTFACWLNSGLTILPDRNLVSNIGFGAGGTHTMADSPFSNMPTQSISFPLEHPAFMIRDEDADRHSQNIMYRIRPMERLKIKALQVRSIRWLRDTIRGTSQL